MVTVTVARMAMASRFEIVLQGDDAVRLRAAGEEALDEIGRLEAQLSHYRPSSELSRVNARAARGPVQVEPRLFRLLRRAAELHRETDGAFDLTVGPLMRCWGFVHDTGRLPDEDARAEALRLTGMQLVHLDETRSTVEFEREGVRLDPGGIGKGFAIEEAALLLQEAGVTRALLHGGTSSVHALGRPLEGDRWKVAVTYPGATGREPGDEGVLAVVPLEDEALSVSAVWGKSFVAGGRSYGHVLDPRTGWPVEGAQLAAAVTPSATDADALSTALLVLARSGERVMRRGAARALVLLPGAEPFEAITNGIAVHRPERVRLKALAP